ncbi:(d)CMP kinase [Halodesulfovibrio marinisediminis]|uniref:Cytidylate kinase n=1 Tax=Halodesulfovibrio marinisediminis DSM 17456 TaxID=1121457 RepID=A0A1N6ID82_9BACT|nr:(d)CMP kinase [Halodesulfovibrio marinisediminis]SIO29977.1 cytidylate kinase [Halodesulfovibrio marinisediminis DSM 17456]
MQNNLRVVTLDGPAGVGKTTLAKRVAQELSIAYLDTGAMFRIFGWKFGEAAPSMSETELEEHIAQYSFSLSGIGFDSVLSVNGTPVGDEIRTEEVAALASSVAQLPVVREALKRVQREIGAQTSLVAEGRDMGSVVFPTAKHKFFLDATAEERGARRFKQLQEMGKPADLDLIIKQIKERDEQDRNRAVAPLVAAEDAHIIDTTELDIDGVFDAIMSYFE